MKENRKKKIKLANFNKAILEGDSKNVINTIERRDPNFFGIRTFMIKFMNMRVYWRIFLQDGLEEMVILLLIV